MNQETESGSLPSANQYEKWMLSALKAAKAGADNGEVPIGAVVVHNEQIIATAHEEKLAQHDPTAHAEILALRRAGQHLGDWRLEDCALFTTLEPCPMCAGAALLARVPLLVYGAANVKFGAVATHLPLLEYPKWNHKVEVVSGVLSEECGALLSDFFRRRRSTVD